MPREDAEAPRGRVRKLTDADLRADLAAGLSQAEIAAKRGVSQAAVSQRVKRLSVGTVATAVAPAEAKRHVSGVLDAMEELVNNRDVLRKMLRACERYLQSADDPNEFELGPRPQEIDVTYEVEVPTAEGFRYEKRKKTLSAIMAEVETVDNERVSKVTKGESRHSDPRDLILKTVARLESTISTAADLARMLSDARGMQAFRSAVVEAVRRTGTEYGRQAAEEIEAAIRQSIVLQNALANGPVIIAGEPASAAANGAHL